MAARVNGFSCGSLRLKVKLISKLLRKKGERNQSPCGFGSGGVDAGAGVLVAPVVEAPGREFVSVFDREWIFRPRCAEAWYASPKGDKRGEKTGGKPMSRSKFMGGIQCPRQTKNVEVGGL